MPPVSHKKMELISIIKFIKSENLVQARGAASVKEFRSIMKFMWVIVTPASLNKVHPVILEGKQFWTPTCTHGDL